jgi:1-aminocyclopropane-1-carboxylate deaminase/D-cysteine desulfhydrase-like pyridoxal-dependent ACC family enzyme
MDKLLLARAEEARQAGRRPYVWERVQGQPRAAVGYVLCMAEICDDAQRHGVQPAAFYTASAGATGAGLALGSTMLGLPGKVRLICPIRWPWDAREDMAAIANRTAALLGVPHRLTAADIEANEEHIGAGYGALTPGGWEAMDLLARTEGLLLDPVYTAKAMAGLIDDVRRGRVGQGKAVVFIHTGGTPAVFAYRDELIAARPV